MRPSPTSTSSGAGDVADDQVKGFVVEKGTPGFTATKIEGKLALRTVQNADIVLTDCRGRRGQPTGRGQLLPRHQRGAADHPRWGHLVGRRLPDRRLRGSGRLRQGALQFGKPIGHFQLIQDLLARMLGNITASLGMAVRVAQLQQDGIFLDEQAALAKWYSTTRLRETAAWAREIMGGNGILLDRGRGPVLRRRRGAVLLRGHRAE